MDVTVWDDCVIVLGEEWSVSLYGVTVLYGVECVTVRTCTGGRGTLGLRPPQQSDPPVLRLPQFPFGPLRMASGEARR